MLYDAVPLILPQAHICGVLAQDLNLLDVRLVVDPGATATNTFVGSTVREDAMQRMAPHRQPSLAAVAPVGPKMGYWNQSYWGQGEGSIDLDQAAGAQATSPMARPPHCLDHLTLNKAPALSHNVQQVSFGHPTVSTIAHSTRPLHCPLMYSKSVLATPLSQPSHTQQGPRTVPQCTASQFRPPRFATMYNVPQCTTSQFRPPRFATSVAAYPTVLLSPIFDSCES